MTFPQRRFIACVLLSLAHEAAAATVPSVDDYVEALRSVAAGDETAARSALEVIVEQSPNWVPAHRALAHAAIRAKLNDVYDAYFVRRLTLNPRDAGAAIGHALLLAARGQRFESHRWLQTAIIAGSRDPLLVEPLLETASSRERLIVWLVGEATRSSQDAPLAALAVRVSLAAGDNNRARIVLEEALRRHPGFGDLHTQAARLRYLEGDERAACDSAALAASYLADERTVPELRIPRRVALARIFVGCGRLDAARQVLSSIGPSLRVPGEAPWPSLIRLVNAEISTAAGDPLASLIAINDEAPLVMQSTQAREWLGAVRSIAYARLGRPVPNADALLSTLPASTAELPDRLAALSALWLDPTPKPPSEACETVARIAVAMEAAGLLRRAARAWLLAAFVAGDRETSRRALGNALVLIPEDLAPAELRAAAVLVRTHLALTEQRLDDAVAAGNVDSSRITGAPGALLARLELLVATAALESGDADSAMRHSRDGALDLQEAERTVGYLPVEFAPLADDPSDTALALAAISFRAARAGGATLSEAGATLLRQLRRGVRRWSLVEAAWPETLDDLARLAPKNTCLVIAAPGPSAPALVAADGRVEESTFDGALRSVACRDARTVLWAGPAFAPGGLSPGSGDPRMLLRLIGPAPMADGPLGETSALQPAWRFPAGTGPQRPLSHLIETLAQTRSSVTATSKAPAGPVGSIALFLGAGLAPPRAPLSSGWLVPPAVGLRQGWLGPDALTGLAGDPGSGLISVGIRAETSRGADRGLWLLAEGALAAGWRWALISRRPLEEERRFELAARHSAWTEDPIQEARRLSRLDPDAAAGLQLWSASGRLVRVTRGNPIDTLFYVPMVAGFVLAVLTLMRLIRRSRRANRPSARPVQHDPPNSPGG